MAIKPRKASAMDFIKSQFDRIQQQLAALSATQKMLTGALVAIMVLTLLYWGKYAGSPVMSPLLDQPFAADDIARVTAAIASRGIEYQVSGDRVLVPADRKMEVLADLGYQRMLPHDTTSGFDEMVKQMSLWESPTMEKERFNRAKEITLSQIISRFPNVQSAQVVIDPTQQRVIGGNVLPSATVYISMNDGQKPSKKLVYAAADVVTGSQAGLPRNRVAVIVDGVSFPVAAKDEDGFIPDDILQLVQANERRYVDKIQGMLSFIPGALVSVTVDLDTVSKQQQATEVDPKKVVSSPLEEDNSSQETHSTNPAGGEPGVVANTGISIDGSSSGGDQSSSTMEKNQTKYMVEVSKTVTTSKIPAGTATPVAAAVRVPRSFFVNLFKSRNPDAKTAPDDAVLKPIIDAELSNIRQVVMGCTALKDPTAVTVETYPDLAPVTPATLASAASAGGGALTMAFSSHLKEIGIGVLAMLSLFMVMMMVRKSSPQPVVATLRSSEPKEPPPLIEGEELAAEVGGGNGMLDGMELDEDAVRAQQMLSQVETMVKENPDAAANLVQRWLHR
jgi:flagellar biosynthesis/type III secretory pathway M-ring protein FliF/YscJ